MTASPDGVLIVGFGNIGQRVARTVASSHRVVALIRNSDRKAAVRDCGAAVWLGDLDEPASLHHMSAADVPTTIFHFAPPQASGLEDVRTANLLDALASRTLPQRVVYISTTGVYGDCLGREIDELSPVNPESDRAKRRVNAEQQLVAWTSARGVALTILRAPGIYAEDRLPLKRLRSGTPTIVAVEDSWSNHIHADDLANAAVQAMYRTTVSRDAPQLASIFNIVDDSQLKSGDYFDLVADHVGLPRPPRVSRAEAESQASPGLLSFMRESRRIDNQKMKSELRVRLAYPTVQAFLAGLRSAS